MKKIIKVNSTDFVEITYDSAKIIALVKFGESTSEKQRVWLLGQLALYSIAEHLPQIAKIMAVNGAKVEIVEVPTDLSFDIFWEAYAYKVGKKTRVKSKWDMMDEGDKVKALIYIKKYNFFLSERPHMERKYPETFLATAEWNN